MDTWRDKMQAFIEILDLPEDLRKATYHMVTKMLHDERARCAGVARVYGAAKAAEMIEKMP